MAPLDCTRATTLAASCLARDPSPFGRGSFRILDGSIVRRLLSADDLRAAFGRLACELARGGCSHEIVIVGGAAVVLGYGAARTTRDVDVYALPDNVRAAVAAVAADLDLDETWMNDSARAFMLGASQGRVVFEEAGLTVRCAETEQLLAMKLCAGRDEADWEDATLLLSTLGGDRDQIRLSLERHWVPGKQKRGLENFEDLWEQAHGPR
jgi:hypothetical protein